MSATQPSCEEKQDDTAHPSVTLSYSEGAPLPENAPHWAVAAHERLQAKWEAAKDTGTSLFGVVPPLCSNQPRRDSQEHDVQVFTKYM